MIVTGIPPLVLFARTGGSDEQLFQMAAAPASAPVRPEFKRLIETAVVTTVWYCQLTQ
jgi:hypothetical protein